jgi:hypothetical protein
MSLRRITLVIAGACAMAGSLASAQTHGAAAGSSGGGTVVRTQPVYTASMQRLQEAADRLRQSIQALAQKPPGPDRERAIAEAHDALLGTQQAMMALPPELRSSGTVSTAGYDESVRKLMQSADSLRTAVQAMAQQPAGKGRNQAIREANRALLDAQAAMVAAYQPGGSSRSMGASRAGSTAGSSSGAAVSASPAAPSAVLVLLPDAMAQGTRLADGCWVRFFDDKGFKGDTLTLAGPVDLPRMEMGDVWRDWDSAVVGPKATVRTFDNEHFRDRSAVLQPGQSIADLRDRKLGWFEEVKSARVQCG